MRDQEPTFNANELELIWELTSFDQDTLEIQVNFTNPYLISPSLKQDSLIIKSPWVQFFQASEPNYDMLEEFMIKLPLKK
jgi:hypothetical protein